MSRTSFSGPWPPRPIAPRTRNAVRSFTAGILAGIALIVTARTLAGDLPGWALLIPAAALCALPFVTYGWGLLETVAPLPEVRGPRHALIEVAPHVPPGDDTLTALADSVLVRRVHVDGDDTPTTALPQVAPAVTP